MSEAQIPLNELPHWFTQKAEARLKFLYGETDTHALMECLINKLRPFLSVSTKKKG